MVVSSIYMLAFFVIFASEDYFRIYVIHKSVCRVLLMGVAQICDKLYGHLTLSHILRLSILVGCFHSGWVKICFSATNHHVNAFL